MNVILPMARLVLTGVFGVAGVAKLADPWGSRKSLYREFWHGRSGCFFPCAELVCAVALVPVRSAWWGASEILALLLLFIAGISISLVRGRRPDCHCFGQVHSAPIGWDLVLRNTVLAGFAEWIVWQGSGNNERRGNTADTALRVARYLGTSANFWMNVRKDYELILTRQKSLKIIERQAAYDCSLTGPVLAAEVPRGYPVDSLEAPPSARLAGSGRWMLEERTAAGLAPIFPSMVRS